MSHLRSATTSSSASSDEQIDPGGAVGVGLVEQVVEAQREWADLALAARDSTSTTRAPDAAALEVLFDTRDQRTELGQLVHQEMSRPGTAARAAGSRSRTSRNSRSTES